MKKHMFTFAAILILVGLLLTGCSTPTDTLSKTDDPITQSTTESSLTIEETQPSTQEPETTEVVIEKTDEPEASETEVQSIEHQNVPGNPSYTQSLPGECNSGFNYENASFRVKVPCDNWANNLFERPVTADLTEFYPYLDILNAKAGQSDIWLYFMVELYGAGSPDNGSAYTYYFELDIDQDGRGDYLIAVTDLDLNAVEWSVSGVRVYEDQNGDVGGNIAIRPDDSSDGDGYDTLLFDQGLGDDPDLAWVRRDPNHDNQIEFAVKKALVGERISFMWWAGAMMGEFDSQSFDLVDSSTEEALFPIDTTCGWIMGYESNYNIRKCYVAPAPTTAPSSPDVCVQPPRPSSDPCWIWIEEDCEWVCFN